MPHRPAPQEYPVGSEAALQKAAHALQNGRAEETAEALHLSVRTVKRDWTMARLWLLREIKGQERK